MTVVRKRAKLLNARYGSTANYTIAAGALDAVEGSVLLRFSVNHCALSASSLKLLSSRRYSRSSFGPFAIFTRLEYAIALARYCRAVNMVEPFCDGGISFADKSPMPR